MVHTRDITTWQGHANAKKTPVWTIHHNDILGTERHQGHEGVTRHTGVSINNFSLLTVSYGCFLRALSEKKKWPKMKFNTALVSLWLVSLLAEQVSGGLTAGALCTFGCNTAYGICVGGITCYSGSAAFMMALEKCKKLYDLCMAVCTIGSFVPTL